MEYVAMRNMFVNRGRGRAGGGRRARYPEWSRTGRRRPQPRLEARRPEEAGSSFALPDEGATLLLPDGKITAVPVAGADPFYVITRDV